MKTKEVKTKSKVSVGKTETKSKKQCLRINDFLATNPTLWSLAWSFLWRFLALGFGTYVFSVIIISVITVFLSNAVQLLVFYFSK